MTTKVYTQTMYETSLGAAPCSDEVKTWTGTGPNYCIDNKLVLQRHTISKMEVSIDVEGREMCERLREVIWVSFFTNIDCDPTTGVGGYDMALTLETIDQILEGGDWTTEEGPPPLPPEDEEDDDDDDDDEGDEGEHENDDSRPPDESEVNVYEEPGVACIDDPPVTTYSMVCERGTWKVTKTIKKVRRVQSGPDTCTVIESTYRWHKYTGPCEEWMEEFGYNTDVAAFAEWHREQSSKPRTPQEESSGVARFTLDQWFAPLQDNFRVGYSGEDLGTGRPRIIYLRHEDGKFAKLQELRDLPPGEPIRFEIDFDGSGTGSGQFMYLRRDEQDHEVG